MKKNRPKTVLALFACSLIITLLLVNVNVNASIDEQVDDRLASIAAKMNKEFNTSSNPYDYIKGNADFDSIVALGNDALPALHTRLSTNETNGLQAYFLAIAIERIAKVDLKKKESTHWGTPQDFDEKWKNYLKSIPASVDTIASDKQLMPYLQVNQLIELGTPALPFILEKVELGGEHLFPAIITLTQDTKIAATENISKKQKWAAKNNATLIQLKQYVLDQNRSW